MTTSAVTPQSSDDSPASVSMPQQAPPSVLSQTIAPQSPTLSANSPQEQEASEGFSDKASGGSRLFQILSAVAKVGSTAMAGIPDKGHGTFIEGLGEGARSAQAAEATQQNIKFKTFDDSLRAASMHNDDLRLQNQTDAQQNANAKEWRDRHDWLADKGYDDTTIPNTADHATNHLANQTTINGSASVPSGSGVNPNMDTIHIPADTQATRDAQKQQYDVFGPIFGLPSRPEGQDFVPGRQVDILNHVMRGLNPDGSPIMHDKLPGLIASYQTQRDAVANNKNVNPAQLNQLDNTIGILKANLKALDDHQDQVFKKQKQQAGEMEEQKQKIDSKYAMEKQDNAASDRPQKTDTNMYVGTDPTGNLVAGTSSDVAGLQSVHKMDTDTQKKMDAARELISPDGLFNAVAQNVKTLNASGKIGTAASRWEDFMAGKVGAGDPDFQALRTNMGLLSTKLMQAHVGARGSHEMLEHFQNLADYHIADANTLGAALKAEYKYVHGVAMLPKKAGAQ